MTVAAELTAAARIAKVRRRYVTLTAIRWLPTGFTVPTTVLLLTERGLPLPTIGLLVSLYGLTTLVLELPTGGLADTIGRRPVLLIAALAGLSTSLMLAFGASGALLAAAFMLHGAGRALDSGPLQAWFVDSVHAVDRDASLRTGLARAGAAESLALAIGALASGALVATSPFPEHGGALVALSTPYLAAAMLDGVHAALVMAWIRDRPRPGGAGTARGLSALRTTVADGVRTAARSTMLRRLLVVTAVTGVALSAIELLAPTRVADLLGGESRAAAAYAVLVTAGFAGSAAGAALAPLAARLFRSAPRATLAGLLVAAIALAGVGASSLGGMATAYVVFYVGLGVTGPLVDELLHAQTPSSHRATVLSVRSMALQGAATFTTASLGLLATGASPATALWLPAAFLALGGLVLVRWPAASEC